MGRARARNPVMSDRQPIEIANLSDQQVTKHSIHIGLAE